MGPDLRSALLLGAWFLLIWIDSTFNRITVAHTSRIASPRQERYDSSKSGLKREIPYQTCANQMQRERMLTNEVRC